MLTSYTLGFHGGGGGIFFLPDPQKNHWFDDPMGTKVVYKWGAEVQKDFECRGDWMLPKVLIDCSPGFKAGYNNRFNDKIF